MRKILFLLIMVMAVHTGAAEETKLYSEAETEAMVTKLVKLGVFRQEEGIFFGDGEPVKRYEAAKMFMDLTGMQNPGASEYISARFLDVPEYYKYAGEINAAVMQGIMNGIGGGLFEPEKEITSSEFLKCMVEILGYGGKAAAKGGYPAGYMTLAAELKLTKNISPADKTFTKADAVRIIYNSLEVPVNEIKSVSDKTIHYSVDSEVTLLEKYHDIHKEKGVVVNNDIMSMSSYYKPNAETVRIGEYEVKTNDSAIFDKIGCRVEFYYKENKAENTNTLVDFGVTADNEETLIDYKNLNSFGASEVKYDENGREKKIKISPSAAIFYNGSIIDENIKGCADNLEGNIKTVDNDGDGSADFVSVTNYTVYDRVTAKDSTNKKIYSKNKVHEFYDYKYLKIIDQSENTRDFENISEGDVIAAAISRDGSCAVIRLVKNSINISVTAKDGDEIITEDGARYTVSKGLTEKQKSKLKTGTEVNAVILEDMIIWTDDANAALRTGYMIYCRKNSEGLNDEAWVRILTLGGSVVKYKLADKVKINGNTVKKEKAAETLEKIKTDYKLAGDGKTSQVIYYRINDEELVTILKRLTAAPIQGCA